MRRLLPRRYRAYCMPFDDGAAPNPFGDLCSLAICKPRIRSAAVVGDWILGTGSINARADVGTVDLSGHAIYLMRVTRKLTMREYDEFTRDQLRSKIPDLSSPDWREIIAGLDLRLLDGTAEAAAGRSRPQEHRDRSRGRYVLLSDEFIYWGANAIGLPDSLRPIAPNHQGHRSNANGVYVQSFVEWVNGLGLSWGSILGDPLMLGDDELTRRRCGTCRADDDENDEEIATTWAEVENEDEELVTGLVRTNRRC